jgi:hypothetical protein
MAKVKMVCPISRGVCVDCAIYRGRHYYLCFAPKYRINAAGPEAPTEECGKQVGSPDSTFGMPDFIELGPKCMRNVEEIVERREL